MGLPTDKNTQDWTPEGGFYEQRANQGETEWEDAAQFDPPAPVTTEDMRADDNGRTQNVSWGDLTRAWPDQFGPSQVYGSGGDPNSSR